MWAHLLCSLEQEQGCSLWHLQVHVKKPQRCTSLPGLSAGRNPWSFICWCPVLVIWPGAHRLESHCPFWGHCASIATGNLQSARKWSHNSHWDNFRKAFHEAARTENHHWQGVNGKQWKTLCSLAVATMYGLGGLIWPLVPCAAPGGLRQDLAPPSTQSFNRLILASLFNALSSVPVGWC